MQEHNLPKEEQKEDELEGCAGPKVQLLKSLKPSSSPNTSLLVTKAHSFLAFNPVFFLAVSSFLASPANQSSPPLQKFRTSGLDWEKSQPLHPSSPSLDPSRRVAPVLLDQLREAGRVWTAGIYSGVVSRLLRGV